MVLAMKYVMFLNLLDRAKLKDSSVVNNSENLLWVNILEKAKNSIFPDIERIKEDDENTAIHDLHTEDRFDDAKENAASLWRRQRRRVPLQRGKLQAAQAAKAAFFAKARRTPLVWTIATAITAAKAAEAC